MANHVKVRSSSPGSEMWSWTNLERAISALSVRFPGKPFFKRKFGFPRQKLTSRFLFEQKFRFTEQKFRISFSCPPSQKMVHVKGSEILNQKSPNSLMMSTFWKTFLTFLIFLQLRVILIIYRISSLMARCAVLVNASTKDVKFMFEKKRRVQLVLP